MLPASPKLSRWILSVMSIFESMKSSEGEVGQKREGRVIRDTNRIVKDEL